MQPKWTVGRASVTSTRFGRPLPSITVTDFFSAPGICKPIWKRETVLSISVPSDIQVGRYSPTAQPFVAAVALDQQQLTATRSGSARSGHWGRSSMQSERGGEEGQPNRAKIKNKIEQIKQKSNKSSSSP
jgi:hypothetical protein